MTEAIRSDAELNASLLKLGLEDIMFVKHYGPSPGSVETNVLRLHDITTATEKRRANTFGTTNNNIGSSYPYYYFDRPEFAIYTNKKPIR